jgi:hypothetical protein
MAVVDQIDEAERPTAVMDVVGVAIIGCVDGDNGLQLRRVLAGHLQ